MPVQLQIPLSEGAPLPFFDFQTALDGATYTLQFRWNVRAASWYLDVLDEQAQVVFIAGLRLCADWPLAAYNTGRSPPGAILLMDSAGLHADPDIASLGVRHVLLYYSAAELGLT